MAITTDAKWMAGLIAGFVILLATLARHQIVDLRDSVQDTESAHEAALEVRLEAFKNSLARDIGDLTNKLTRDVESVKSGNEMIHDRILERAKLHADRRTQDRFTGEDFATAMVSRDDAIGRLQERTQSLRSLIEKLDTLHTEYRKWTQDLADRARVTQDATQLHATVSENLAKDVQECKDAVERIDALQRDARERLRQMEYQLQQQSQPQPGASRFQAPGPPQRGTSK